MRGIPRFMPIIMRRKTVPSDDEARAYHRRQNLYAKRVEGLQRVLDVQ